MWEDTFSFNELSSAVDEYYRKEQSDNAKLRIVENTVVQLAGQTTKKVVTENTANDEIGPHRMITYYVLKDGKERKRI
ncbi:hypothetical protein [Cohnella cholangitidis]|uniref:Uncharacterized protein n=1 Tax=Cohnella cholangitidis TaxID=2598458 RepID=A0A7G5BXD3_9BACL|nr:hypothetical protein [Cohnella cholangitidis]QMV41617.1 hypothetical protein FPL14_10810 [Cohnella cholangitidis]